MQQSTATARVEPAVFATAPVIYLASASAPQRVRMAGGALALLTGLDETTVVATPDGWRGRIAAAHREAYDRAVASLAACGSARLEYPFARADGGIVWLDDELKVVAGTDPLEFVGCATPVLPGRLASTGADGAVAFARAIMETAPDAVVTMDEQGIVQDFNPAAEAIFGYSAAQAAGRQLSHLIIPERLRQSHADGLSRFRATRAMRLPSRRFETVAMRADGSEFPAELTVVPVALGVRTVFVGQVRDLSERYQAEQERERLNRLLQDGIDSLPNGFVIFDAHQRIVMCNAAFAEPYGRSPQDIQGMTREQLIEAFAVLARSYDGVMASDGDAYLARVKDKLGRPGADPVEVELTDGQWRLISSFPTASGGVVTTRTDITRIKTAEIALRQSEAMVRLAFDACPVPVGITRASDGHIIYESPDSRRLFGRDAGRGPITTRDYYVDPADREAYVATLRENGRVDGFEVKLRRSTGEEFWGAISARLIQYRGEEVIVSSTQDLTERHQAEQDLARQREVVHQSEKLAALGELLASVAHELNNPLSVVVGQALLLKETTTDPKTADRAAKIGNAADRCARIVRTFLAMARQQPAEYRAVDLNVVVEQALEVTGYALRSADIEVRLSMQRDLPAIWGDSDQLNQVLTNLILNAQKAMEEIDRKRRIKIITAYRQSRGEVVVKVKDNGLGVPEAIRSRIFEPFFTTKRVGSGTGIGLAFCHRIVSGHGGTIVVEPGPVGACFVVRFPCGAEAPTDTATEDAPAAAPDAANVLVIDDERAVVELIAEVLRHDGHRVDVAYSGRLALDLMSRRTYDVVLSDLRMPDLDGQGLYQAVADRHPGLLSRLAFITGDTMSVRVRSFLATAGRPYIDKPVTPDDLRDLVYRLQQANG